VRAVRADGYQIDDDPSRLDLDAIVAYLTTSAYWGRWRGRADIAKQVAASTNVGLYSPAGDQVGFARIVTDGVSFGYLADVYVLDEHRGRGLGHALVEFVIALGPSWRWLLSTRDAHRHYAKFGFGPGSDTLMERPPTTG
jgi:GNAT superfamily N-acetyltransferase